MSRTFVFLSHADKDKNIAERIAVGLKKYHYDVFLAHKDIEPGSDWEEILKRRIEECDLFLALLSSQFVTAKYTDHEVGIAVWLKKKIIPLSIDGTLPYGFMSKYQSSKLDIENMDNETQNLNELFKRVMDGTLRNIDVLISDLTYARSFREANGIATKLSVCSEFTDKQFTDLVDAYNENIQVRGSWTAGPFVVDLLEKAGKLELIGR